ncbi:hypothetical protein PoB_001148800 [Plakobranchus ocellatus]|uniref:Uncharacterized protein n=1 Tax=Plakobranchus ocellatus TaxID=259542 RepID=A0AAV3YRR3_9GAST|nr:hypothetical protein PoB_001148800 [Plakobranchus ocellatus]
MKYLVYGLLKLTHPALVKEEDAGHVVSVYSTAPVAESRDAGGSVVHNSAPHCLHFVSSIDQSCQDGVSSKPRDIGGFKGYIFVLPSFCTQGSLCSGSLSTKQHRTVTGALWFKCHELALKYIWTFQHVPIETAKKSKSFRIVIRVRSTEPTNLKSPPLSCGRDNLPIFQSAYVP